MAAVALALGASVAWGCSDFLAGLNSRKLAVLWVLLVSQGCGLVLVVAVAGASGFALPGAEAAAWAAAAGIAELIGFAALYRGFAVGAMSVVAPVGATAAIVPVLVAFAAGTPPTALQCGGTGLALAGAALASFEPRPDGAGRRVAAGMALAILAALAFGAFFVATDMAAADGPVTAVATSRAVAVAVLAAAVLGLRRGCPLGRRDCVPLLAIGALDITANTMFAVALTLGVAAAVSVLGSLYPVATVILARVVLREHLGRPQRAGVGAALAGIALVAA